ncbi:hypothetical protein [Haloarchaeobius sp. DFWS5]|uniref:hypothetical protein n=1 Tax=Haloarchaeobius sp. DFWS5 TaxID=3446114 RepID=UPI003EBAADAA
MDYTFTESDPINSPDVGVDEIRFSIVDSPGDHDYGQRTFSRIVSGEVIETTDSEVVVKVNVVDNINGGMFGLVDYQHDAPGGTRVEYEKELRFDRKKVESRIPDNSPIPMSLTKAVVPDVMDWAKKGEFKAEPEDFPDEFRYSGI